MKKLAEDADPLPRVERSAGPDDDYLLALCEAGNADYLVTGDKNGLLGLDTHKSTRIISARDFAALFFMSPHHFRTKGKFAMLAVAPKSSSSPQ